MSLLLLLGIILVGFETKFACLMGRFFSAKRGDPIIVLRAYHNSHGEKRSDFFKKSRLLPKQPLGPLSIMRTRVLSAPSKLRAFCPRNSPLKEFVVTSKKGSKSAFFVQPSTLTMFRRTSHWMTFPT